MSSRSPDPMASPDRVTTATRWWPAAFSCCPRMRGISEIRVEYQHPSVLTSPRLLRWRVSDLRGDMAKARFGRTV